VKRHPRFFCGGRNREVKQTTPNRYLNRPKKRAAFLKWKKMPTCKINKGISRKAQTRKSKNEAKYGRDTGKFNASKWLTKG